MFRFQLVDPGGYALAKKITGSDETIEITSPLFSTQFLCFEFAYFMIVDDYYSSALTLRSVVGKEEEELWKMSSAFADMWYTAQVELNQTSQFKVRIEMNQFLVYDFFPIVKI